jgi:hypothetical protein
VFSVTGVFAVVPAADTTRPVPFWQMTNYVAGAATDLMSVSNQFLLRSGANGMLGELNAGGFAISNVAGPSAPGDAATKQYVDGRTKVPASLVSGECDTNLVEILFSTNYTVAAVSVYQPAAVSRTVYVYTNGLPVTTFSLSAQNDTFAFSPPLPLARYVRLGIAVSETNSVLQFCFEAAAP